MREFGDELTQPDIDWNSASVIGHSNPEVVSSAFIDNIHDIGSEQIEKLFTRKDIILDIAITLVNKCVNILDSNIVEVKQKPVQRFMKKELTQFSSQ